MTTPGDSGTGPEQPDPVRRRDLWELPELVGSDVQTVHYDTPRRHAVPGGVVERATDVEIVIRTDGPIPIRALSPALFVGDVELAENEQVDDTTYRFFVGDTEVSRGAPIRLGWVGHPPPRPKADEPVHNFEPPPNRDPGPA